MNNNLTTMSIHRALAELKGYDKKIQNAMLSQFICCYKKGNDKINGKTKEEIENNFRANYDRVVSLMSNRKKIKSAIALSNANTMVTIGGVEYTVTDAIERKAMIEIQNSFLQTLTKQYKACNIEVDNSNLAVDNSLEKFLQQVLGDKDNRGVAEIEAHTEAYMARNRYALIDPLDLSSKISKLYDDITNFSTEVDYKLSESNATTFISVDLTTI